MSSPRDLRLQVILQAVDKAGAVLRGVSGESSKAAKALKDARDKLKELNKAQSDVQGFRTATVHLRQHERALLELQGKTEKYTQGLEAQRKVHETVKGSLKTAKHNYDLLATALADGKGHGAEFTRQLELARITLLSGQQAHERSLASINKYKAQLKNVSDETSRLQARQASSQAQLEGYKRRLEAAGIGTSGLASKARELRGEETRLNTTLEEQKKRLDALVPAQKRLAAARAIHDKAERTAGAMAIKGATAVGGGAAVLRGLHGPVDESKGFGNEVARITALGLGDRVVADAEKFARGMNTYGVSARDNMSLVKDALSVFADLDQAKLVAPTLAKMKFANEAVFGAEQGHENEKKFMDMLKVIELRGGVNSAEAFLDKANKIQRVINATGGRVAGEEWLNLVKRGGIAAMGLSDEALYYQLEPLVQASSGNEVGTALMSAYQGLYQGQTTKRAANLLEKLGLIGDHSKVDHDKSGQIAHLSPGALKGSDLFRRNQFEWMEQVLLPTLAKRGITDPQEVMNTIGGILTNRTASKFFGQMYTLREAVHKNAKLNAGAYGVDQLFALAQASTGGAEVELAARKANAYRVLGDTVMPAYTKALELAAGALQGLTGWMQAHPTLARALTYTLGGLAVVVTVLGGALMAMAPGLLVWAGMRLALTQLGIMAPAAGAVLRGLAGGVLRLGLALATNPITWGIAAIAGAAYLVYRNWDGIVAWLDRLPERFESLGLQITLAISRSLQAGGAWVRDSITGLADDTLAWFKERLGIRSPSRVFIAAGGEISAGAALGIAARLPLVHRAALSMATAATSVLPLPARAAEVLPLLPRVQALPALQAQQLPAVDVSGGLRIDRRPPLSAAVAAAPAQPPVVAGDMHFHIHPAPGMDERALARLVAQEVARLKREEGARRRSSLHDLD